ncbi:DUF3822 family protein [Reichenbachiella versicolor]|uniref:DUF3822 family protein n=1 Tax=Reichenbachiella versicolor TaxID=1821036 RepID=UPI0013A5BBFE|nr:DUF3822 family protein [Reichenbachiella versicolor]
METASKAIFKLLKRVKDDKFDVDSLHNYNLSLQIGVRDLQVMVVDTVTSNCVLLESYGFQNVATINSRLQVLMELVEAHQLLRAGFWKSVKVSLKTHKFSLVPTSHFVADSIGDYLKLNCTVNDKIEGKYYYQHKSSNVVNAFAFDRRLINWIKSLYPSKEVIFLHQGSALIEGILRYTQSSSSKMVYAIQDKGVLHVFVAQNQKLLYYNQFSIKSTQEFVKYILMVFKEFSLNPKSQNIVLWGTLSSQSEQYIALKKFVANVNFGERADFLKLGYQFDDILEHQFFDLFCTYLCD